MAELSFPTIGFIGAGKMATALVKGLLNAGLTDKARIVASDPAADILEALVGETGIGSSPSNAELVKQSELIILAVKPQVMESVLTEIGPHASKGQLLVSIAAGIPLANLSRGLSSDARIARVMPNTPALNGAGASGYCLSASATKSDAELVRKLLSCVGVAHELPEKLMDAVTGLSGSGPAYVAVMIEALSDGGVRAGLPRDVATDLAVQTVLGTARLLREENISAAQLKEMVASPGGTTIAGLHALEKAGFRAALMDAVEAATNRSKELGA